MSAEVHPIGRAEAFAWIDEVHRTHGRPTGWKFGACVVVDGALRAVACAGRPVARGYVPDKFTIEITRVASDGAPNACSRLYGALCSAARALGYRKAITYTDVTEKGVSPKAAGFDAVATVKGRDWGCKSRPRAKSKKQPNPVDRIRWERAL